MSQEITAELRVTLPDGVAIGPSPGTDGGDTVGVTDGAAEPPPLPDVGPVPPPDPAPPPSFGAAHRNGSINGGDPLADLPPELRDPERNGSPVGAADVGPPSVQHLEALVAAAGSPETLPPEVARLVADVDADSASLAPPDVSELPAPRRSPRRKPKG